MRMSPNASPMERLLRYTDRSGSCWLWTGGVQPNGYGRVRVFGVAMFAHRFAFELLKGPIPDGLQLDHLCRVRHCVNPEHLEPVTARVNQRRGKKATAVACVRGHDLTDAPRRKNGTRRCNECQAIRARSRRQLRREQAA
jgi:hypothetical protein